MFVSRIHNLELFRQCINAGIQFSSRQQLRLLASGQVTNAARRGTAEAPPTTTTTTSSGEEAYPFLANMRSSNTGSTEFFVNNKRDTSWKYQKYIVHACTCIFMLYFLVLRKENHIDKNIALILYEAAPDIERHDLRKKIDELKKQGKNTEQLEQRLDTLLKGKA